MKAITTCVILHGGDPQFAALGNAICWAGDNFSRRFGRRKAFCDALDHCGLLRPYSPDLFAAYLAIDPDPPLRFLRKLGGAEKRARWEAGWEKRQERLNRQQARQQARQNLRSVMASETGQS